MLKHLRTTALSAALCATLLGGLPHEAEARVTAFKQAVAESMAEDAAIAAFYRSRGFEPIWTSGDTEASARLSALMAAMRRAGDHGLPQGRWDPDALVAMLAGAHTQRELGLLEVEVSRLFLDYARAVSGGVIRPRSVLPQMVREPVRKDGAELLRMIAEDEPVAALRSILPRSPEYARLMRAKMRMERLVRDGGWGPQVPAGKLAPGARGAAVVALRDRLRRMGYLGRSVSATYDREMEKAVRAFQAAHGLEEDGVAGGATMQAINATAADRLGQVLVAMERERWLNFDRGDRHVWVNLTDFSAAIVDEDVVTFRTRSVIGKAVPDRATPEFSDVMEHMVINPSWYVPRSIIVKEYLPRLQSNPGAVGHLQIIDSRGRVVNRGRGFSQYSARSFPFSMRQPPGPRNALGTVKFMFPNKHNIYLHDTPQKHLFARDVRAYSHGCVRLADPHDFAYALLAAQEDDPRGYFQRILRSGAETRVDLVEDVPVHLVYRTAFTDVRGRVHYREDVYGRDARVLQALYAAGVARPGLQG